MNENRLGVVGIVVDDRTVVNRVNQILSEYSEVIVGRMGVPCRQREVSVISLIVDGTTDEIGAMTGKLGNIKGVQVKSALASR
ncbi:MAG: TM1266 family iron-only hydrogenase system putative regulator [Acidobacteriota bacterium]